MNETGTTTSSLALDEAKVAATAAGCTPYTADWWAYAAGWLAGRVSGLSVELDVWKRDSVKVPF